MGIAHVAALQHTSICMFEEGYAQGNKYQATNDEVRGDAVDAMQYRYQGSSLLELVLQV